MNEERKKEAERFLSLGWQRISHSTKEKYNLRLLYRAVNNKNPCCADTLQEFFKSLNTNLKKKVPMKKVVSNCDYELHPGVTKYVGGKHHTHVNNSNLTNELAQAIIKENPNTYKKFFKVIPKVAPPVKKEAKAKAAPALKSNASAPAGEKEPAGEKAPAEKTEKKEAAPKPKAAAKPKAKAAK
jgi:hypothetical protein